MAQPSRNDSFPSVKSLTITANAASDAGVASLLASAALKGAIFNVEINLQSLPEDYGIDMRKGLPGLIEDGRIYSRQAMDAVRDRLSN